jgi:hypothetical protein
MINFVKATQRQREKEKIEKEEEKKEKRKKKEKRTRDDRENQPHSHLSLHTLLYISNYPIIFYSIAHRESGKKTVAARSLAAFDF